MQAWTPLITDPPLAARARRIIEHVCGQVAQQPGSTRRGPLAALVRSPSLASGLSGAALLAAQRAHAEPGWPWGAAIDLARGAVEVVEASPSPGLFNGLAGLGFAVEHVARLGGRALGRREDPCGEIDTLLESYVLDRSNLADPQLVLGLAGLGVYWLERLPRRAARRGLAGVVRRLAAEAEVAGPGLAWRLGPAWMTRADAARFPDGRLDLSVAHGHPGVVGFLASALAAGVEPATTRYLLEGGVRWLLAARRGSPNTPDRLAWCVGDLGTAVVLWRAGLAARRRDWVSQAHRIARRAARQRGDAAAVVDAMLCHGAAGNAHLFGHLFQWSGDAAFARAARHWYRCACDAFDPERTASGFRFYIARRPGGRPDWVEDYGLLNGTTGVALALHAGLTPSEPSWDRVLLAC